ncbi:MAG TPA: GNAT family N-acetyltransferase [Rhodanobacteraceae bacterium]|nr:GNAT family N-acetyltransferase [Rhodanobacteraceae bacterium]
MPSIKLVPYDEAYLERSWVWLNDPEIRELTMTPVFTRQQQCEFFAALDSRSDYLIWGVELISHGPIGAAGLKNHRGTLAEYWGYIGEKRFWGQGLGRAMVGAVEQRARGAGFDSLDLKVARKNLRASSLYHKLGYNEISAESTAVYIKMGKSLP